MYCVVIGFWHDPKSGHEVSLSARWIRKAFPSAENWHESYIIRTADLFEAEKVVTQAIEIARQIGLPWKGIRIAQERRCQRCDEVLGLDDSFCSHCREIVRYV